MRGLRFPMPSRAMAVALFAVFLNLTGIAYAATGGNFILGQANTATTQTTLTRNGNGKSLQITNTGTGANAAPLSLTAGTGRPPFATNSGTKVTNLNADALDGFNSTDFYFSGSKVTDSFLFDGHNEAQVAAAALPRVMFHKSMKGIHQDFSGTFTVTADPNRPNAVELLMLDASAYSTTVTPGASICLMLSLNGGTAFNTGACATIAINETLSHKAMVSNPQLLSLQPGTYTATLWASSGTLTNNDDYYSVNILAVST